MDVRGHLQRQRGSFLPLLGQERTQGHHSSLPPPSGQEHSQGQAVPFSFSSAQGHGRGQNSSFPRPLGGQGQTQGHLSFPPPPNQGQAQDESASLIRTSVQAQRFQEQHSLFPPQPTEYGRVDAQQDFWTPPMTPTYPLTLEQCHVPRYPVGPAPNLPPNGHSTLPTKVWHTDVQAYPEPNFFNMGLEDLTARGWGSTAIPTDAINPWGTVTGDPIEQPFPSDAQPVLRPANQQTYDDYESRLFAMGNEAQTPRDEQRDAGGDTGKDPDGGRFEMFIEQWARDLAGRQQPDGEVRAGQGGEVEAGFDGIGFERAMAQLTGGLETPLSMGSNSQSTETNARSAGASAISPGTNALTESNTPSTDTDAQPAEASVKSSEIDAQPERDIEQAESRDGEDGEHPNFIG